MIEVLRNISLSDMEKHISRFYNLIMANKAMGGHECDAVVRDEEDMLSESENSDSVIPVFKKT